MLIAPRMLLQGIPNKQRMLGVLRDPHASSSTLATPSVQHIIGQPLKQKVALPFLPANVADHVAPFAAILSPPLSSRMEKGMAVGYWDVWAGFSRGAVTVKRKMTESAPTAILVRKETR